MGNFVVPLIASVVGGVAGATVKAAAIAANTAKIATPIVKAAARYGGPAAITSAVTKAAAPKPPSTPTQISNPPTMISLGEQSKGYGENNQMDLLSTIIAGKKKKNKLG